MAVVNKSYKAEVTCSIMIENDNSEMLEIQSYISNIRIDKNYYDNIFPVYSIEMKLPGDIYKKIQQNDVYFNLNVTIKDVIASDGEFPNRILINDILIPIDKGNDAISFEDPDEELMDENTYSNTIPKYDYTIHLLSQEDYSKNKILINELFADIRPKEALLYILDKMYNNSDKKIIVEPVDNNKVYSNILIPPLNAVNSINYLQKTYGIYNSGLSLYIDNGNTYVIRKSGKIKLNNDDISHVNILLTSESEISNEYGGFQGVQYDTSDDIANIIYSADPIVEDTRQSTDQLSGEVVIFGSYDDNFDMTKRIIKNSNGTVSKTSSNKLKTKYYWNTFNDKIFEDEFIYDRTGLFLSFVWNDIDPYFFNIVNNFNITTKNEKINGLYRINNLSLSLSSVNSDTEFNIIGKSTFSKI